MSAKIKKLVGRIGYAAILMGKTKSSSSAAHKIPPTIRELVAERYVNVVSEKM